MAVRGKSICRHPSCAKLLDAPGYCDAHARQFQQKQDAQRGTAHQRGYGYRWQKARVGYLAAHPLCACCAEKGIVVAASVVDHITPHKGDMKLFWDSTNWQSLCKPCHDHKTATEDGGFGRSR